MPNIICPTYDVGIAQFDMPPKILARILLITLLGPQQLNHWKAYANLDFIFLAEFKVVREKVKAIY